MGVTRTNTARVLVACSGGKDSMALVRVSQRLLGARAEVGHVDHAVNPASDVVRTELQAFVEGQGLRFRGKRLQPPRHDEATLRDLRYSALAEMQAQAGAVAVLTAHTRDDQAETVLFRLLRARSWFGVRGMPPRRGAILRPWLDVSRAEVHRYLAAKGWPSWEDPSNREPRYLRNRLRKELLPLLERRYVAGVTSRLAEMGQPSPAPRVRVSRISAAEAPCPTSTRLVLSADHLSAPILSWSGENLGSPGRAVPGSGLVHVEDPSGAVMATIGSETPCELAPGPDTSWVWVIEVVERAD